MTIIVPGFCPLLPLYVSSKNLCAITLILESASGAGKRSFRRLSQPYRAANAGRRFTGSCLVLARRAALSSCGRRPGFERRALDMEHAPGLSPSSGSAAGDATQAAVIEFLSKPGAYPGTVSSVSRIGTHAALVFLAGDRAYKLKRGGQASLSRLLHTGETQRRASSRVGRKFSCDARALPLRSARDASGRRLRAGRQRRACRMAACHAPLQPGRPARYHGLPRQAQSRACGRPRLYDRAFPPPRAPRSRRRLRTASRTNRGGA